MKTKSIKIKVYPLGEINDRSGFLDLFSKEGNLICTLCSLIDVESEDLEQLNIKNDCVIWGKDKLPDVYINDRINTISKIKKSLKILENDEKNKFEYIFINKNSLENYYEGKDELSEVQEEIISKLKSKWEMNSSLRFGQLLSYYINLNPEINKNELFTDLFQYKDEDLLKDLLTKKLK